MYVIFKNGGKQYKAYEGKVIRLEKLNIEIGKHIELNEIILISNKNKIYTEDTKLKNIKITAKVINHGREKKIFILKFHRRKHFLKYQGHRQWFTDVKIINLSL